MHSDGNFTTFIPAGDAQCYGEKPMDNIIEKWTGIISGTNRGLISLELKYIEGKKVVGSLKLFDPDEVNLSCEIEGTIEGRNITGEIFSFQPQGEGMPTSGTVNLTLDEVGKEML